MQERTIILLSCSRDKLPGGKSFDASSRRISSTSALPHLSNALTAQRRRIFSLLRGRQGRLYDEDQRGGFRDLRSSNRELSAGPDFGDAGKQKGLYQPAFKRYQGRFFVELSQRCPTFWEKLRKEPVEILFVSGLYGLLLWDEMIQDYDCHLADYVDPSEPRQTVAKLWRSQLTDIFRDFLEGERRQGRPVRHIYDMLSEEIYQSVFDWEQINNVAGIRAHHRLFRPMTEKDALPYVAAALADQLQRFCEGPERFEDGKWYPCPAGDRPPAEFSFEPLVRSDSERAVMALCYQFPVLVSLRQDLLDELALAEDFWRKGQSSWNGDDFGIFAVAYGKCLEHWLITLEPTWNSRRESPQNVVRRIASLRHLAEDVGKLWRIRNEGAHAGSRTTKTRARNARDLLLRILTASLQGNGEVTRRKLQRLPRS